MCSLALAGNDVRVERRHAAVLFADLTGFTALVESASPETVYALVRPLMDELVTVIRDHGGEIQQVLGDGFMAVFGLRPSIVSGIEDATISAIRAAVALVRAARRHESGLPAHVGVECGEVLISPSWEPARFAVWGRAVTVAKRLCDLAGPDTVHLGPQAFRFGGEPALAGLGVAPVIPLRARCKGIAGDIPAYRVRAAADGLLCALA